jgi:hypothetical protein
MGRNNRLSPMTLPRKRSPQILCGAVAGPLFVGIPVFAGIPIAGLASAATPVRSRDFRWACYSVGSSTVMAGSLLLVGAAIRGQSRFRGKSGIFQRISIAVGFGWLSCLSLRGLSQ